jgi:rare lipoprotein A
MLLILLCSCSRNLRGGRGEFFQEGLASFYGPGLRGHLTASGERFDPSQPTAAHRTLPFETCLVVENEANGRSGNVRVNDRGPYAGNRILDVSESAARALGMIEKGLARVKLYRCDG